MKPPQPAPNTANPTARESNLRGSLEWAACAMCDALFCLPNLTGGHAVYCPRCGDRYAAMRPHAVNDALALSVAALTLLLCATWYPFLGFAVTGQEAQMTLLDSATSLFAYNQRLLGLVVFLLMFAGPLALLLAMVCLMWRVHRGIVNRRLVLLARAVQLLKHWNMVEVFLIGAVVSIAKISSMAQVQLGLAFWCFIGFTLCTIASVSLLDMPSLWRTIRAGMSYDQSLRLASRPSRTTTYPLGTAAAQGLLRCGHCNTLADSTVMVSGASFRCGLCSAKLTFRTPYSVQQTLAYLCTAVVLLVPANLYPIMITAEFGAQRPSTIVQGVVLLWHHGSYPTALIIFIASVVVPLAKILALLWLCFAVVSKSPHNLHERKRLLAATELVGRWSMVDVFVVALLVALVQVTGVLTVAPGPGALAFCGVVLFTMLAAHGFDGRLLWDQQRSPAPTPVMPLPDEPGTLVQG